LASLSSELILDDLQKLLIVRVPDTPNHKMIQDFILAQFTYSSWKIDKDSFETSTPYGIKNFVNIIATYNQNATNFLILAAHYDSKYFKNFKFVGAVDSAVPCAILLDIVRTLESDLLKLNSQWGVKIIFFDGEEALNLDWSDEDSLYGSRHLAQKWQETITEEGESELSKIRLFVLLDLIGARSVFHSYSENTKYYFLQLASIEDRLKKLKILKTNYDIFSPQTVSFPIADDHIPFQERGVKDILHLIPPRFPPQWHRASDDFEHLDIDTVMDWATIMRIFTSEYLNL